MKIIETNKKASFDYYIEETIEAGIVLSGPEVKSIKLGNCSLKESFCHVDNGEMMLKNMHIAPYEKEMFPTDTRRDRKLLLHRREISRLIGKSKEKGYTIVPTKIYFSGNKIKVELGLGKGKHSFDKRETIKQRDIKRDTEREIARY